MFHAPHAANNHGRKKRMEHDEPRRQSGLTDLFLKVLPAAWQREGPLNPELEFHIYRRYRWYGEAVSRVLCPFLPSIVRRVGGLPQGRWDYDQDRFLVSHRMYGTIGRFRSSRMWRVCATKERVMSESDIHLYLPTGESDEEGYAQHRNLGGDYRVAGTVKFSSGRFHFRFEYCGDAPKKRLRTGSISLTPAVIGRMMEALHDAETRGKTRE
jgi:hypothetical protein